MTNLKIKIMRRVYAIWFFRKALPYLVLEAAAFVGFTYFLGRQVYIARVLEYGSSVLAANIAHPLVFLSFTLNLFVRTHHFGAQIAIIGASIMIFFLCRGILRSAVQMALAKETNTNISAL